MLAQPKVLGFGCHEAKAQTRSSPRREAQTSLWLGRRRHP